MLDNLLFVVFPYVAVALALGGTVYRYLTNQFSFTSLSSQFLESDVQFWGSTLWHYGILPTLAIHLAGFTLPKVMAVSYTHLRAHETVLDLVCRLLLEKKTTTNHYI